MNKKYINDAIRTDLESYSIVNDRLKTIGDLKYIFSLLKSIEVSCSVIDLEKKFLFYGKERFTKSCETNNVCLSEDKARLLHSLIGIITEVGELCVHVINILEEKEVDLTNVLEEFGDISWYQALGVTAISGLDKQIDTDFLNKNIEKLKARYPNKFTEHDALNRNLEKERNVLEG